MSKRYTVDETWELCLKMWKWIAEQCDRDSDDYVCVSGDHPDCPNYTDCPDCPHNSPVCSLKEKWLEDNDYQGIKNDCFFCDITKDDENKSDCCKCQLRIEGVSFNCTEDRYNYEHNPKSFYAKLLKINKIRLGAK